MRRRTRSVRTLALAILLVTPSATAGVPGVDEVLGEATYEIPLVTPPGPAGSGPQLALVYRSGDTRGGAGWLGVGWRLAGESAIARDLSRGVPFDYASSCGEAPCYLDAFALDGEPLVCAEASCDGEFRTLHHEGLRIRAADQGFQVRERDGTTRHYGTTAAARIVNARNGQVFAWLLERVEDVHGSWTSYSYDLASSPGVAYLSRIEYAQAGAPPNRSVHFSLAPRPDRGLSYRAGFRQETNQRLVRIDVRAAGDALVAAYELHYAQSPDSSRSLLTSLQRIGADERAPAAPFTETLPPWRFDYTESGHAFESEAISVCPPGSCPDLGLGSVVGFRETAALDLNRDGLLDAYDGSINGESWASAGSVSGLDMPYPHAEGSYRMVDAEALPLDGVVPDPWPAEIYGTVRDIDGDGYPDWLKVAGVLDGGRKPQPTSEIHLGGPAGFASPLPVIPPPGPAALRTGVTCAQCGYATCPYVYHLAGRSRTDILYGRDDPRDYDEHLNVTLLDMNGDRRLDWVFGKPSAYPWDCYGEPPPASDAWLVYLNEGVDAAGNLAWAADFVEWVDPFDAAIEQSEVSWSGVMIEGRLLTLDLNADGLPDRLSTTLTVPISDFEVAYNNGAGFDPPEPFFTLGGLSYPLHLRWVLFGSFVSDDLLDLNGDGYPDQVIAPGGPVQSWNPGFPGDPLDGWLVRLGTGSGLRSDAIRWGGTSEPEASDPPALRYDLANLRGAGSQGADSTLLDFNGDGLLDTAAAAHLVYLNQGPQPDLLLRATSPAGGSAEFAWQSSARMSNADGLPANPGMGPPRPVVEELRLAAGRPEVPQVVTRYHYAGGALDDAGSRFHGFATVTRTLVDAPPAQGRVVSEHRVDAACEGRLAGREVFDGNLLLSSETHEYGVFSGAPGSVDTWYVCLRTATTHVAVEGGSAPRRRSRTEWSYAPDDQDSHYEVAQARELGEVDVNRVNLTVDDDRYTDFGYATGEQIPARVAQIVVRAAPGGPPLSHTRFFYDGLAHGEVGAGLLTRTARLLESPLLPGESRWLSEYQAFDAYGNPTVRRGPATADDPDGHAVATSWDDTYATFPVSLTRGADPGDPALVTGLAYDGCGAPPALGLACRLTDPRGQQELRAYDGLGRLVDRTLPTGLVERHRFELPAPGDPAETLHSVELDLGDGAPLLFETWSDGFERVFAEISPGKQSERIRVERSHDARGRLSAETEPHFEGVSSPRAKSFAYDVGDRPLVLLASDGETRTELRYAPWVIRREVYLGGASAVQVSERRLDGRGRPVEIAQFDDPAGLSGRRAIRVEYDALDRLTRIVDPIGNGSASCLPEFSDCSGQASRHETQFAWDTLGRRVRLDDPDRGVFRFDFDDAGLLTRRTDPAGRMQMIDYDTLQRPAAKRNSYDWYGAYDAELGYGADPSEPGYGKLVSVRPHNRMATYYKIEHDAAGRIAATHQRTLGRRWLVNRFALDPLGRVTLRTFPDGEEFRYVYDGLRLVRIEGVALTDGGTLDVLTDAEYDAAGRTTRLVLGELNGSDPAAILERSHDPLTGRLSQMRVDGGASAEPDLLLDLDFDGLGRLVAMSGAYGSDPLGARSFAYDGAGRLVGASGPISWTYAYDALGNLVQRTRDGAAERCWRYGDPLRPRFVSELSDCSEPIASFAADPAGLTASVDGQPLIWNAENRLHEAPVQAAYRPLSSVFQYDVAGRLTGQRIAGGIDFVFVGDDFSYDDLGRLANKSFSVNGERVATRATSFARSWTAAPPWRRGPVGAGLLAGITAIGLAGLTGIALRRGPPAWLAGQGIATLAVALCLLPLPVGSARAAPLTGGPAWLGRHREPLLIYGADHLGSTRVVIDAGGQTVETRDYEPFGATISHTGAFNLAHRFAGRRQDDMSGLVHQGARFYAPEQGRFLSPDPSIEGFDPDGLHPWAYARNQPTSRIDPDGRASAGVVVRAVLGGASMAGLGTVVGIATNPFAHYLGLTKQGHIAVTSLSFLSLSADVGLVAFVVATTMGTAFAAPWIVLALAAAVFMAALATFLVNAAVPKKVTIEIEPAGLPAAATSPEMANVSLPDLSRQATTVARFRQPRAGGQAGPMAREAARSTALTYYHTGIWLNVSGL